MERAAVRGGHRRRLQRRSTATPVFQKQLRLPSARRAGRGLQRRHPHRRARGLEHLRAWARTWFFRFGGTSAGSPQWAGLVALAGQLRHARVGYLNPQVYALSLVRPVYTALFHDITTGDNTFHGEAYGDPTIPGFPATPGWDPATGLGTPKANTLVPVLGGRLP